MLSGRPTSSSNNLNSSNSLIESSNLPLDASRRGDSVIDRTDQKQNGLHLGRSESVPNVTPETKVLGTTHNVLLDQERYLPIANVVRIMKTQMDPQAKLAKDAKECVQECVSEFISFIASEAAEFCHNTKRKTITADDLLTALEATGFDNYAEPMRIFLMKYRQAHKVTGPIHRSHANYMRPKQFMDDQPLRPFFFDTDQGRRCTETQYVVNGSEVVKNAPLADEWNEQTGTLNAPKEGPLVGSMMSVRCANPVPKSCSIDDSDSVIALEQQQQMQIYVDPTSKQHYAAMETSNGMELYPIMIQDTPVQLENVTNDLDSHGQTISQSNVGDKSAKPDSSSTTSSRGHHSTSSSTRCRPEMSPPRHVPYKKRK